jgi:hypothetical protein
MTRSAAEDRPSLADLLTTASAASHFAGEQVIRLEHLLQAIRLQTGELTMEELGKPVSPLVQRYPRGLGPAVEPQLRELVQRWFLRLGSQATVALSHEEIAALRADIGAQLGLPPS